MTGPDPKHPSEHEAPPAPKRQEPPTTPEPPKITDPPPHEGALESDTGDRSGPGAGFDNEPKKVKDKGGVAPS